MNKFLKTLGSAFALSFFLALCLTGGAANAAASLKISPVRIVLSEGGAFAAVNVQNQGSEKVVVQLQLVSWTQENGENIYGATDALIACPPIFTIEGGKEQVIRIGLVDQPENWDVERAHRLFVQEVPPPPSGDGSQIRVAVRISIPVFMLPTTPAQPQLVWSLDDRGDAGVWVTVENSGNMHVLVGNIQLQGGDGFQYEVGTHKYILPGANISWRLDETKPIAGTLPEKVELTGSTDQGVYRETLPVKK